jgi:hypothetical protein
MKMKEMTREEQLEQMRRHYQQRGHQGKARILDELCELYSYHRKHAIRLMSKAPSPQRRPPPGPQPRYKPIREVVQTIWSAGEQPCGKRLVPMLPLWLPHYQKRHGKLLPSQRKLVDQISAATADRLLIGAKTQSPLRGLSGTKPGTLLRKQVPIQGEIWDEDRAGFLEADSVAHCGGSLAGNFVWSLTYTDIASTWTEGRAVWNKGSTGVLEQTRQVEQSLPFSLLGFDFDNGGEWLNWHLIAYLQERATPVKVTRSRPFHSDDNAHVEQKNWMWARQLLGYGRLEDATMIEPLNALYREIWGPMHNFFLPSMKLINKWREGSRWHRQHDIAQTAYQRLLSMNVLNNKKKRQLRDQYESLDPFALHEELDKRLAPVLKKMDHQTT